MERKHTKVRTYKEFLREKNQNKINEDVKVEVDWWDECIQEVMQILEDECNGYLTQDTLFDYVKTKFAILGRTWDEFYDNIYILHIKDLIFQLHGDSLCVDMNSKDNSVIHSKGLVIEELAKVIWGKVLEKTEEGTMPSTPTTKLVDKETVCPDECIDDLLDELTTEDRKMRNLIGFERFSEHLNEAASKLKKEDYSACTEYCLDRIEEEAGNLDPDSVFDAAVKNADGKTKGKLVFLYVQRMVEDFLKNSQIIVCNLENGSNEEKEELVSRAVEMLSGSLTGDVLHELYILNGGKDNGKVE